MSEPKNGAQEDDFIKVLEDGIRTVLKNRKSSSGERIQAITAGAKLLIVKHKITGGEEENFFNK